MDLKYPNFKKWDQEILIKYIYLQHMYWNNNLKSSTGQQRDILP